MTNNEIIFETVRANFTPAQLAELVAATYTAEQIAARRAGVKITVAEGSDETPDAVFHAMLAADTFHTFAEWKRMGYSVKKGQHAALTCQLWKYTTPARLPRRRCRAGPRDRPPFRRENVSTGKRISPTRQRMTKRTYTTSSMKVIIRLPISSY
ncbi:MAG: hypothetical protein ACLUEK_00700 [Oscillospiraceae bacterium]